MQTNNQNTNTHTHTPHTHDTHTHPHSHTHTPPQTHTPKQTYCKSIAKNVFLRKCGYFERKIKPTTTTKIGSNSDILSFFPFFSPCLTNLYEKFIYGNFKTTGETNTPIVNSLTEKYQS